MEKAISIETSNLIALSYIIDEYDSFCEDFKQLVIRSRDIQYTVSNIQTLLEGAKRFIDKRIKQFFDKYCDQIRSINNHVPFANFMYDIFTDIGTPANDIKAFHDYLASHRDEAYKILDILYKVNKLGIGVIELDENADFTSTIYDINRVYFKNKNLYYVENIKPVPAYTQEYIRYTSSSSNYEIILAPSFDKDVASPLGIRVNSLLFEPERLPSRLTKEVVFDSIVELARLTDKESSAIRKSVDLNIGLMDLEKAYYALAKTSSENDSISTDKDLVLSLKRIRESIDILRMVVISYDNEIVDNNAGIDHDLLNNEKNVTLMRRNIIK